MCNSWFEASINYYISIASTCCDFVLLKWNVASNSATQELTLVLLTFYYENTVESWLILSYQLLQSVITLYIIKNFNNSLFFENMTFWR